MQTQIIYIPGFGSNAEDSRLGNLIKQEISGTNVHVLSYDNFDPRNAQIQLGTTIHHMIKNNPDTIIIGQSLGGYWANYYATKYAIPVFLINPSLFPQENLLKKGIDPSILKFYKPTEFKDIRRQILVSEKDEVVNWIRTRNETKDLQNTGFEIMTGIMSHRIDDYTQVINNLKHYVNNIQES